MTLPASCHCGAVRIEIDYAPETLTQCTCSICRRYGAMWAYYTRKDVRISCAPDALEKYRWGDKCIDFARCRTCGCMTHYEDVEEGDDGRFAVNARMMEPGDIASIRVRTFDGADSWKYLD